MVQILDKKEAASKKPSLLGWRIPSHPLWPVKSYESWVHIIDGKDAAFGFYTSSITKRRLFPI